jgi:AcrR family transcriptional regulator
MQAERKAGRVEEAQKTREALIAAATQLFVEQGLDRPSLDAICARAGFTRGAFYVHFRTRDELIAAVVESAMGGFIDAMIKTGEAGADLGTIVRTFAAVLRGGPLPFVGQVRGHQIMEACLRSPTLRQKYNELLAHARERLCDTVRRGQDAGTVRGDVDPHATAQLLLALVLGAHTASEIGAPYDADRVGEDVLRMLAPIEAPARKRR